MYNSTKMYIKNQLIQLINQCNDTSTKQGRVTLDDIRDIIDELEDDNDYYLHPENLITTIESGER